MSRPATSAHTRRRRWGEPWLLVGLDILRGERGIALPRATSQREERAHEEPLESMMVLHE